ncbi:hypothetical protein F6X68_04725 [Micromonospora sp. AMSO12t]|uniref:DivIVA domain-containing protein n=1 Tax=unclassified Micromonospora TaxID=2617518 RepID=UPI00124B44B6|nr:hypothetical protein [Micromonospora sp. AMSO12t]KAB1161415.1 hypothetical protein F6X68_04725 [Micromonospora sp. AMSO12t]
MSIADDLERAVDTCLGPRSARNTSVEARHVLNQYSKRAGDPQQRQRMDEAVAEAELGIAAYLLGVHYQVHGRPDQAEHWLRTAADRDVADAAVRLAMLLEYRSVIAANTSIDSTPAVDDDLTAARRWYRIAAHAGYHLHDDSKPADPTPLTLDCCPAVEQAAGVETAEEIIGDARRQADALLRQARADVRIIIETARQEVNDLAGQRAEVEQQMQLLQQIVTTIAAAETQPRRRRWRPSSTTTVVTSGNDQRDAWRQMADHFRRQEDAPRRRAVRRSLISRIMAILQVSDAVELDVLDLDVESKEAVAPPRLTWAPSDTSMRARAG